MTAITVGTLALTRRKQLPFGQLRTTQSAAFGTRGFVGGTNDPTGLTHLGAREYDPTLGRFLSTDPVIDVNDPAQMNAYSYAHNNPLTKSDPDGLRPGGPAGGASYNDDAWARDRGMNAGYTLKGSKWVWHQTPKKDPESQKRYRAYRANPTGYLINDSYARQRANKAAEYRAQAKARAKEQARWRKVNKIAEAVNRGFRSTGGSFTNRALGAILEGGFEALGMNNAKGSCASFGFGLGGATVGVSGCVVAVRRTDGSVEVGWTRSVSTGGFGKGGSVEFSALRSNADEIGQFAGFGRDIGGGYYRGLGGSLNHETAIGMKNNRGRQVQSIEMEVGAGAGFEVSSGMNYTQSGRWKLIR